MSAKILIVTPHSETAMQLLGLCARYGFYISLEAEVKKIQERLTGRPDCIIIDDAVGAVLSPSLIAQLRSTPEGKDAAILAIGNFSEKDEVELFKAAIDDVINKPLRSSALVLRIARLMKRK